MEADAAATGAGARLLDRHRADPGPRPGGGGHGVHPGQRRALLRQLPYPQSAHLVEVSHAAPGLKLEKMDMSARLYLHYLERSKTLAGIALSSSADFTLSGDGEPVRVPEAVVSPSAFRILRVKPELGRAFSEEEGRPGGTAVVVILSHDLWQRHYGGKADILGRLLHVNGKPREVVGVMPAGFDFPSPTTELWVPRVLDPSKARLGYFNEGAIARVRNQVTLEAAQTELTQLTRDLVGAFPDEEAAKVLQDGGLRPVVKTLLESAVGKVRPVLWTLLAVAGLILAIACANVANLFLVRFEERSGELAIRGALGASRGRLVGGLFAEGLALAALAGGVAVLLAWAALRLVVRLGAGTVPRLDQVGIDAWTVLFTLGAALLAAVLACLLPALRATRIDLAGAVRDDGRASAGLGRHRLRHALVAAQVALGVVLLVACGLVVRSLLALQEVDPGFRTSGAATFQLFLPAATYPDAPARVRFLWRRPWGGWRRCRGWGRWPWRATCRCPAPRAAPGSWSRSSPGGRERCRRSSWRRTPAPAISPLWASRSWKDGPSSPTTTGSAWVTS